MGSRGRFVVWSPAVDADVRDAGGRAGGVWKSDYWKRVGRSAGCWLWRGAVGVDGCGVFLVGGRWVRADRLALQLAGVPAPRLAGVVHGCGEVLCVNPAHLSVEFRVRRRSGSF